MNADTSIQRTSTVTFVNLLVLIECRRYGEDCVEDIKMGNCRDQSLYARVIVRSPAYITLILGENELKQFDIHGKDMRVRRFVPKPAPIAAASTSAN